jgi:hypothetical protein
LAKSPNGKSDAVRFDGITPLESGKSPLQLYEYGKAQLQQWTEQYIVETTGVLPSCKTGLHFTSDEDIIKEQNKLNVNSENLGYSQ